jgi:hypothetical protein
MANSCPNFLGIPSHKPLTCAPGFGLLTQFGYPYADDKPNCKSNESLGMRVVALKSEQQTATPDQR